MILSNLTLSDIERSVKVTQILSGIRSVWYTYICLQLITTLIWMSKENLLAAGFSTVPAVFLVLGVLDIKVQKRWTV